MALKAAAGSKRFLRQSIPFLGAIVVLTLAMVLSGCKHEKPNFVYMPDMAYSPALKAQEEGSMRTPVEGTVPRGFIKYRYEDQPEAAGRELKNNLPMTKAHLLWGQELFTTHCSACHGMGGEGDGLVATKFGRPPSFHSDKVRGWSDGRIYHVITMGQNLMPGYGKQVEPVERWAIVNYIRVLQRAHEPRASDLEKAKNWP